MFCILHFKYVHMNSSRGLPNSCVSPLVVKIPPHSPFVWPSLVPDVFTKILGTVIACYWKNIISLLS